MINDIRLVEGTIFFDLGTTYS